MGSRNRKELTMWRPKNWETMYNPRDVYLNNKDDVDRALFEVGADTILRAALDHLLSYPDDAIPDELRAMKNDN